MGAQDRIYARALGDYAPEVVAAACDEWAKGKQFWPELASLMTLCSEHERLMEYARRPKLVAPTAAGPEYVPPEMSDDERLAMWRRNDQLVAESGSAGGFASLLASGFSKMRPKREREYPALAARYYAEQGDEK